MTPLGDSTALMLSLRSTPPPAPWQRVQWATKIGCTSFANVGDVGSAG